MKALSLIPLLVATSSLTCILGTHAKEAAETTNAEPKQADKATLSAEDLATQKSVPASIKNPQGDFTLVAVVEGAEANRRFTQSLRVVDSQRQRLATLTHQFEKTAINLPQQRELLATQINEIRKALKTNLEFMSQNFAYSLNYSYLLIPHKSSLVEVLQNDAKTTSKVVYQFNNPESYNDCQKKRESYIHLKQKQAQEIKADNKTKETSKLKPTPEMEKIRKELIHLYNYDLEKNYQINFEKTAIYARPIK